MASDFRRYAVSRSDSISRHKEIGTITAVGSPPSFETYWISASAIVDSLLRFSRIGLVVRVARSDGGGAAVFTTRAEQWV